MNASKLNPLWSYLRHWLTLQAIKVSTWAGLPNEGLDAAINYGVGWLVEALILAVAWAAAKYGPAGLRALRTKVDGQIENLLAVAVVAGVAGGLLTGCGQYAEGVQGRLWYESADGAQVGGVVWDGRSATGVVKVVDEDGNGYTIEVPVVILGDK